MADGQGASPAPRAAARPVGESSIATADRGGQAATAEGHAVALGVGLDRLDVLLADDDLEGLGEPGGREHDLDVLAPGRRDDRQADAPREAIDQRRRPPDRPGASRRAWPRSGPACGGPSPRRRPPRSCRRAKTSARKRRSSTSAARAQTSSGTSQPSSAKVRCQAATWTFSVSAITPSKSNRTARGGIESGAGRDVGGEAEASAPRIIAAAGPCRQIVDFPPVRPYVCGLSDLEIDLVPDGATASPSNPGDATMARPVTLFTGQWADLTLEVICQKASQWGYDGIELPCWGDHFNVQKALQRRQVLPGAARPARPIRPEVLGDLQPPGRPGRPRPERPRTDDWVPAASGATPRRSASGRSRR